LISPDMHWGGSQRSARNGLRRAMGRQPRWFLASCSACCPALFGRFRCFFLLVLRVGRDPCDAAEATDKEPRDAPFIVPCNLSWQHMVYFAGSRSQSLVIHIAQMHKAPARAAHLRPHARNHHARVRPLPGPPPPTTPAPNRDGKLPQLITDDRASLVGAPS
jgi:hypothetical protein